MSRNLYAGALVKNHAGDTAGAMAVLQEIIESPVAYRWSARRGDSPFFILRNAEDVLARIVLDSEGKTAAEQVYRSAIVRREEAEHPDKFQIILARQRLARFLRGQGDRDEARKLLTAALEALADAPTCFDWLKERVHDDIESLDEPQTSRD